VTDEAQVAAAVDLVVELHDCFDVMLRNAMVSGCLAPGLMEALDLVDFDRIMAINARVAVAGVKHATHVMVPRRAGSIVCTTSVAGVLEASRCRPIVVQGRRSRTGACRGWAARAVGCPRQRHLADLQPHAARHGQHGRVVPRRHHQGAQADRGEGHERCYESIRHKVDQTQIRH
jgi:hypothetical protein